MTSTARGCVDEIFETYILALAAFDQCPESAEATIKDRLAANVEQAERTFAEAVADGLSGDGPAAGEALHLLAAANTKSRQALRDGTPIGAMLADLERATGHALRTLAAGRR